jgi:hypothetical protein
MAEREPQSETDTGSSTRIRWLAHMMFLISATTTDAVGSVIPRVIHDFGVSMRAAGAFHYAPMVAIALGSGLFVVGRSPAFPVRLPAVSGLGISIFRNRGAGIGGRYRGLHLPGTGGPCADSVGGAEA